MAALACGLAFANPAPLDAVSAALRSGNASGAATLATQALADSSLNPRDRARLLVGRGLAQDMLGARDAALADFTEAIEAHILPGAEEAKALYDRGVVLDELGRTADAAVDYSGALKLSPKFAAAYNNRGNAYRRLGRLSEARADYLASIAAGNAHLEYPNYGLGQIAEADRQIDDARGYYRAALAANPNFSLADDRLHALGNAVQPVVLKPPSGGIHLKPPAGMVTLKAPGAVHLKPPGSAPSPARTAKPDLKPALSDTGGTLIQLGAWREEKDAVAAWNRLTVSGGNLLAGLTPQVVSADVPGQGRFYRLRAGPVAQDRASGLCAALTRQGLACIVVRD
ncbi:MAG: tetratricopeptide repeat protein [Proteobacteria bacterium]|nr:tetratricopeptide repeat protein [Pseudomonadota bacterium]